MKTRVRYEMRIYRFPPMLFKYFVEVGYFPDGKNTKLKK